MTQVLASVGAVYHVRRQRSAEILYTVRGELMSATPRFYLVKGEGQEALADLCANFIKTKYDIAVNGEPLASIVFPAVAFKKTLILTAAGQTYLADGGVFKGIFQCKDDAGEIVLEIAKELAIRDTFRMSRNETLPLEVGLLSVAAIHSRYYEMV